MLVALQAIDIYNDMYVIVDGRHIVAQNIRFEKTPNPDLRNRAEETHGIRTGGTPTLFFI